MVLKHGTGGLACASSGTPKGAIRKRDGGRPTGLIWAARYIGAIAVLSGDVAAQPIKRRRLAPGISLHKQEC